MSQYTDLKAAFAATSADATAYDTISPGNPIDNPPAGTESIMLVISQEGKPTKHHHCYDVNGDFIKTVNG